jgi:hypothetical protein
MNKSQKNHRDHNCVQNKKCNAQNTRKRPRIRLGHANLKKKTFDVLSNFVK